jgi:site-specific recombinase XerD
LIGFPQLKPHDLRHGVAMEVYEQHHDLEQVRALLGHVRLEMPQIYARIQPQQLKNAMHFYEARALEVLSWMGTCRRV